MSVSSNTNKPFTKIGNVSCSGFGEGGHNPGGFITYVCLKTSWIDKDVAPPSCSTTSLPRTAENPALKIPNLDIFTEKDSLGVIRMFAFEKLKGVGTT